MKSPTGLLPGQEGYEASFYSKESGAKIAEHFPKPLTAENTEHAEKTPPSSALSALSAFSAVKNALVEIPPHPLAVAAPKPVARSTRPEQGKPVEIFDRRQRFQIGTPTYGGQCFEVYLNSLRACEASPTTRYRNPDGSVVMDTVVAGRLNVQGDSHIDRARNITANQFMLQNETDWLLWVDGDIQFFPQHIARMFQHAMNGHKFVCGHYAMKCLRPTFVANIKEGQKGPDPATGLIELTDGGTGFMLCHRDVFTALQSHPRVIPYQCAPNTPWPGAKHYPYFQSGTYGPADPKTGLQNWLSEDWMLCRLWQELGGRVMGDTEIKLHHQGSLLFPPKVPEIQEAMELLLNCGHPAIAIEPLRAAVAKFPVPLAKAA